MIFPDAQVKAMVDARQRDIETALKGGQDGGEEHELYEIVEGDFADKKADFTLYPPSVNADPADPNTGGLSIHIAGMEIGLHAAQYVWLEVLAEALTHVSISDLD